jgi:cephalosporin hydroxylase
VVIKKVKKFASGKKKIIVFLDSDHSYTHVLKELELYSPLVSKGSYIVAFDTLIEYMPGDDYRWGKGNNPKTAVDEFLKRHKNFRVDKEIEGKLVITAAPGGFLKRVR